MFVHSALSSALRREFPEIESVTTLNSYKEEFLINDKPVQLNAVSSDSNFLHVFNLPFKYGSAAASLQGNNDIVITETIADTYFHDKNPIGLRVKQKRYDGSITTYIVKGL